MASTGRNTHVESWLFQVVVQALIVSFTVFIILLFSSSWSLVPVAFLLWFCWQILHNPDYFLRRLASVCVLAATSSFSLGNLSKIEFVKSNAPANENIRLLIEAGASDNVTIALLLAGIFFVALELLRMYWPKKENPDAVTADGQFVTISSLSGYSFKGRAIVEIRNNTSKEITITGASVWHNRFLPWRRQTELTEPKGSLDAPASGEQGFAIRKSARKTLAADYIFRSFLRRWLEDRAPPLVQLLDRLNGYVVLRVESLQASGRQVVMLELRQTPTDRPRVQ